MRQKIGPFLLGLSLAAAYVLGCATSHVSRPLAQARVAPPGVSSWEYFCTAGRNVGTISERANAAGQGGWELVGVDGEHGNIWCFTFR